MRKITEAALVMELVDGTPLDQIPQQTPAQIAMIFSQVAKAARRAARKRLHRLRPQAE